MGKLEKKTKIWWWWRPELSRHNRRPWPSWILTQIRLISFGFRWICIEKIFFLYLWDDAESFKSSFKIRRLSSSTPVDGNTIRCRHAWVCHFSFVHSIIYTLCIANAIKSRDDVWLSRHFILFLFDSTYLNKKFFLRCLILYANGVFFLVARIQFSLALCNFLLFPRRAFRINFSA